MISQRLLCINTNRGLLKATSFVHQHSLYFNILILVNYKDMLKWLRLESMYEINVSNTHTHTQRKNHNNITLKRTEVPLSGP